MKKIKVIKRLLINFLLFGFISFPAYSNVTEDLIGKNLKVLLNDNELCSFSIQDDGKVFSDCIPDSPLDYRIIEGEKIKFIFWGPYKLDSGEEQSVAVFYNTSSNFVYSTKPEEKDAEWTNNYLPHEISEIVNQEIILNETDVSSNENVNNIFFKVVSKDKFIDVYGEEACLTKFEVTNKSNYTLVNDESISFDFYFQINSDNDYEHVENVNFVNPHLNKTDPDFYEDSIEYFTVGMKSNLGGYLSSFDYGEHSSIVTSKKCKRIKKYILSLSCEVYTADKIWDANENEIDWKSDKKAYRTIQESLAPHPDHDKKKYGKIIFKRDTYC